MKFERMFLMVVLVLGLLSGSAAAKFPDRPINLVVPVAAGGGSDMVMRALAREVEENLGVPVVVVNRVGAGGAVGLTEVAGTKPDGYTLVMITEYNYNLPMTQQVAFTVKSFDPIATVNFDPAAIAVRASSPWKSLEDLISFAKANPGVVTVGNSGFGNIWHIAATAFEREAGIKLTHVPFTGAAPTVAATLGGHVSAMVASPPEMAAQVKAGNMRILAVMSNTRAKQFPNVPTLKDLGVDLQFGTWRGIAAPAGTPAEVLEKLESTFHKAIQSARFEDFMAKQGLGILWRDRKTTVDYMTKDELRFRTLLGEMGLLRK